MRLAIVVLVVLLGAVADAAPQSPNDLVVVIPGTRQFHQPGCPLLARAGSHVQVMKRSDATRRRLTAHDCVVSGDANQVKVYSQPNDNKYHLASCARLGATRTTLTLEEAGRKLWPCPMCHPPIRQRTGP
jgi:hypothetical protein